MARQHGVVEHTVKHLIPINLDQAISEGQVKTFADAGEVAGAVAIRWGGRN